MSRSSDRAQVEPIPALVAVFAVGAGLTVYAGVLANTGPERERALAEPVLEQIDDEIVVSGVAEPDRLSDAASTTPEEHTVAVTLTVGDETWQVGPDAPPRVDRAEQRLSVRIEPGTVRSGTLRVEVWT